MFQMYLVAEVGFRLVTTIRNYKMKRSWWNNLLILLGAIADVNWWNRMLGDLQSWFTYVFLYPIKRRRMRGFFSDLGLHTFELVFDIGAHLGDKTRFFAEENIRVIACEPQPRFVNKLRKIFGDNPHVEIVPVAVGKTAGQMTLHQSSRHPTVSTLSEDFMKEVTAQSGWQDVEWDQMVEVEVTTVTELIDQYGIPDFTKIDVEGFEAEVLWGLDQPLPLVSFEYLPAYHKVAQQCITLLEQLGEYKFCFSPGETFSAQTDWLDADAIQSRLEDSNQHGDIYARQAD